MHKFTLTFLLTLVTAIVSAEHSDRYLFRMLDTSSGLPDNNVRNMTMLPNGLMCIQTPYVYSDVVHAEPIRRCLMPFL